MAWVRCCGGSKKASAPFVVTQNASTQNGCSVSGFGTWGDHYYLAFGNTGTVTIPITAGNGYSKIRFDISTGADNTYMNISAAGHNGSVGSYARRTFDLPIDRSDNITSITITLSGANANASIWGITLMP